MAAAEPAAPSAAETHADGAAEARAAAHWLANCRLAACLLGVWFTITFVAVYFARELSQRVFGWPFSFWMAAQGSLVVYVLIVWWYARRMRRVDAECGMAEDD